MSQRDRTNDKWISITVLAAFLIAPPALFSLLKHAGACLFAPYEVSVDSDSTALLHVRRHRWLHSEERYDVRPGFNPDLSAKPVWMRRDRSGPFPAYGLYSQGDFPWPPGPEMEARNDSQTNKPVSISVQDFLRWKSNQDAAPKSWP